MRVAQNFKLTGLGVLMAVLAVSGTRAGADVTTDRSGSIVIFPKVIADGTRDTIIELTNTSNMETGAHCWYLHGERLCRISGDLCNVASEAIDCPGVGDFCQEATWQENNFDVFLTKQQPTFWRVSTGRVGDPNLESGSSCGGVCSDNLSSCTNNGDCNVSATCRQACPGFFASRTDVSDPDPTAFPANVPPQGPHFQGELRCIQTDTGGAPSGGDRLKGEAIIEGGENAQISEYNSINIQAINAQSDLTLQLNGSEYNACPDSVEFSHYADGASDLVASGGTCDGAQGLCFGGSNEGAVCTVAGDCLNGGTCRKNCPVLTQITIVPCTEDQEGAPTARPGTRVPVHFEVFNEFEEALSATLSLDCWSNLSLSQIDAGSFLGSGGSTFLKTRIRPASSAAPGGLFCNHPLCNAACTGGAGCSTLVCDDDDQCGPQSDPNNRCEARKCAADSDCGPDAFCAPASGILAVVEEFHNSDASIGSTTTAPGSDAWNVHMNGSRSGVCSNNLSTSCASNADCGTGNTCRTDRIVVPVTNP